MINGKLVSTSQTRHGINPATKKVLSNVPVATQHDVDVAVKAAKDAFKTWSKTTIEKRRDAILKFAEAFKEHTDDFTKMLTTEQGKATMFAQAEVETGYLWLSEIAKLDIPEEVIHDTRESKIITRYTPLGVCVGIVPWNFPVHLAMGKIVSALITGNTFVLKPSPFTPYCGLKIAELGQQFLPPGIFQALSGDDNLGPWLTAHLGVDKIGFTGSTFTGKRVMESTAKTLKRVTLEPGGNDPAIICKSADIKAMAPAVATLAFLNSGQVCICIKRIYVHSSIYDEFRDAMVEYTKTMKVGEDPMKV